MRQKVDRLGGLLVDGFNYLALFAIGGAIVWSAGYAFIGMAAKGHASIDDILLLFIYLELARWWASTSRPTACRCAS